MQGMSLKEICPEPFLTIEAKRSAWNIPLRSCLLRMQSFGSGGLEKSSDY